MSTVVVIPTPLCLMNPTALILHSNCVYVRVLRKLNGNKNGTLLFFEVIDKGGQAMYLKVYLGSDEDNQKWSLVHPRHTYAIYNTDTRMWRSRSDMVTLGHYVLCATKNTTVRQIEDSTTIPHVRKTFNSGGDGVLDLRGVIQCVHEETHRLTWITVKCSHPGRMVTVMWRTIKDIRVCPGTPFTAFNACPMSMREQDTRVSYWIKDPMYQLSTNCSTQHTDCARGSIVRAVYILSRNYRMSPCSTVNCVALDIQGVIKSYRPLQGGTEIILKNLKCKVPLRVILHKQHESAVLRAFQEKTTMDDPVNMLSPSTTTLSTTTRKIKVSKKDQGKSRKPTKLIRVVFTGLRLKLVKPDFYTKETTVQGYVNSTTTVSCVFT